MKDLKIGKNETGITFPVKIIGRLADFQVTGKYPHTVHPYVVMYRGEEHRLLASDSLDRYLTGFDVGTDVEITLLNQDGKQGYSVVCHTPTKNLKPDDFTLPSDAPYSQAKAENSSAAFPPPPEPMMSEPVSVSEDVKWDTINRKKQESIYVGEAVKLACQSMGTIIHWTGETVKEIRKRADDIYNILDSGKPCTKPVQ